MKSQSVLAVLLSASLLAIPAFLVRAQDFQSAKTESPAQAAYHPPPPPYVELENVVQQIRQWYTGSWWMDVTRWFWTYDDQGREIEHNSLYFDSGPSHWEDMWRITTAYDESGRKTEEITEEYATTAAETRREQYVYDETGNLTEEIRQSWSDPDWLNDSRNQYVNDDRGRPVERVEQTWSGSEWINEFRELLSYDDAGNQTESIRQEWISLVWMNRSRTLASFDEYGNHVADVFQSWNGSDWMNESRWIWIYDASGNMIEEQCNQEWTGTEWQAWGSGYWGCSGRKLYTYDASGKPLVEQWQRWEDGNWVDDNRSTFLYDDLGRLIEWTADADSRYRYVYATSSTVTYPTYVPTGWMLDWTFTEDEIFQTMFTDADNGVALGYDQHQHGYVLLSTSDGGASWSSKTMGTNAQHGIPHFADLFFTDAETGTVVGNEGTILRTVDGGLSWQDQSTGGDEFLSSVFFTDAMTGTVVGFTRQFEHGVVLRTTDGGETWVELSTETTPPLSDVFFTSADTGLAIDVGGAALRTADGGQNWHKVIADTTANLFTISFSESGNGTILGADPDGYALFQTSDGGETWTRTRADFGEPQTPRDRWIGRAHFADRNTGMAVGAAYWCQCMEGAIVRTTDAGVTWERAQFWDTGFRDIYLIDANTAVAVGSTGDHYGTERRGVILRLTFLTATGIEEPNLAEGSLPGSSSLYQNYPNPFNPTTTIQYDVAKASVVRLTIFDALGRIVESLVNSHQSLGSHTITWDASGLPSGVYFYRLEAGDFVQTKPMILVK